MAMVFGGGGGGKSSASAAPPIRLGPDGSLQYYDPATGKWATVGKTATATSGGGSRSGGGSGGSASASNAAINRAADIYRLWLGDAWVASHRSVIQKAASEGWTDRMIIKDAVLRGANTPYAKAMVDYIRSVCGPLPLATVQNILASGVWLESDFATRIAPQYSTDILSNPQSLPFVQLWNRYTAAANFGPTAQSKLKEIVTRFGFTSDALNQWEQWLTTTDSANNGNYGADKREIIRSYIERWFGRPATDKELSRTGPYWNMVGGLMGQYETSKLKEALRSTDEYKQVFYAKLPNQSEEDFLSWKDAINSVGDWYFNDRPGAAGEPYANNFKGFSNEELAILNRDGWTADELMRYYKAVEEAAYNREIYEPILKEAFGDDVEIDWFALANGGRGSAQARAKLVEAQNRVQFREAFRQVFGRDPDPEDYDRITQEFISPSELIREYQAIESVDEMFPETNELLQRVFGETVTKEQLKDMVLGRPGSGELKALINEATKLDQFTWIHKQYYGTEPTPEDYARYAGYTGPAELQWEIVTNEKVKEMLPEIQKAWAKVYPNEPLITEEDLFKYYGEQEGYGDIGAKLREMQQKYQEIEQAEQYQYSGAEQAELIYGRAEQGGFKTAYGGLAELE